jgi:glucosamine--fructose-6-phosphate aminotransferase (isomerizing)
MQEAKSTGAKLVTICNVIGAAATRMSDGVIYTNAGPEIGVASTKAFTSQVIALLLLTLKLTRRRSLPVERGREIAQGMERLPAQVQEILDRAHEIEAVAEQFKDATNFLYLGRGFNFPAAEMKHGPIALIDANMPVVFIAPHDAVFDKVVSNVQEVKARGGRVITLTSRDEPALNKLVDYDFRIPETLDVLYPILTVIPLQLLAYYIAARRGLNVDQPRNLAKSVTVE